jgi:uncharacterized membrane protein
MPPAMPIPYLLKELSATWLDVIAVALFITTWVSYTIFSGRRSLSVHSLHTAMDFYRREWMVRMIERDNRMVDINVLRNLNRTSQFFASTTMFILGTLIALTGYVQQALDVVSGLPFTLEGSARLLELKILLLILIFVYAFFKFSWSIRQFNFCSTLVGAAPKMPKDNPEQYAPLINRIATIASYAGSNYNHGLRAYYFGMAALSWFLHPWLMIAATLWVVGILYHREFDSKTLKALVEDDTSPSLKL